MYQLRPFQNTDLAGIVSVWNRLMSGPNIAVPISNTEFDLFVVSRPYFFHRDLIVATYEKTGEIAGFVHCGFGPEDPLKFCRYLSHDLGTIAMLCAPHDPILEDQLIQAGIGHLKSLGSKVIYGGGRHPLNPFYWSIYGGSEFSGFLESQPATLESFRRNGFKESASSVLFEFDLAKSEPKHLKNIMLKRESRLQILEDENPEENWSALAVEAFHPLVVQILDKAEKAVIARSCLWPMSVYGRREGVSRIGLIDVIVDDEYRRKGYGRLLIAESIKCASGLSYDILCVQTDSTNLAAIKLYEQSGFVQTETARLFRLGD